MNPQLLARGLGLMSSGDPRYDATGYRENGAAGYGSDPFYSTPTDPLNRGGVLTIPTPFNPYGATARSPSEAQGIYVSPPTQTLPAGDRAAQANSTTEAKDNNNSLLAVAAIAALVLFLNR